MKVALREGDIEAFFDVPFNVYPADAGYVSPMRSDIVRMLDATKNPLWQSGNPFRYWTAHRDGKPIGRIVALVHRQSNARHGWARCQFGFFDCSDNAEAARQLLTAAQDFGRAHGMTELVGNFNLTAMQQAGVMTDGFSQRAYTDMVVNAAHIPALLEANGFKSYFPMTTFEIDLAQAPDLSARPLPESDGFAFAPIEKSAFAERMSEARLVLNDGFDKNPMFVPLTAEEFQFQAGEMSSILDPRLSSVLLHDGQPIATIICIPDLNGFLKATRSRFGVLTLFHFLKYRFRRRRAVIIFYSVASAWHGQGIMPALLARTIKALKGAGYESLGVTWIADENAASLRQMERLEARPLHRLHLYRKDLA